MRCGVTGLRPTFGRVPRTGAMTLCWSLDKLGPMTRTVEDFDAGVAGDHGTRCGRCVECAKPISNSTRPPPVKGLRVGYFSAKWMEEANGYRH